MFRLLTVISLLLSATSASTASAVEEFSFHHEAVIGTSCGIRVQASSPAAARSAETAALAEIDRLAAIFSSYSPDSELSRFAALPVGESQELSQELSELFRRSEHWTSRSRQAFNPAVEMLSRRWQQAVREQRVPELQELSEVVQITSGHHFHCDSDDNRVWTRTSSTPLTFNAIAKGTMLDLVCRHVLAGNSEVQGIMLDLGGDIRVAGSFHSRVQIADPRRDAIGAAPIWQGWLSDCAIATSGLSERRFIIGDTAWSHIIDPRSGLPVDHIRSSSVIAADAETADVLATICSVLPIAESLALVDEIPKAACLLVDRGGRVWCSTNWPGSDPFEGKARFVLLPDEKKSPHEVEVKFEIAKPDQGGRYRRPYVAVWVEDKDGFPVKTLSLFLMAENPGPRWHRDLRRWYSADQVRQLVDDKKLIGTISKPTRNPGQYTVAWDGTDDGGSILPEGEYTLFIESAREHGTYQLIKQTIQIGGSDYRRELKGNLEISSASVSYAKKSKP